MVGSASDTQVQQERVIESWQRVSMKGVEAAFAFPVSLVRKAREEHREEWRMLCRTSTPHQDLEAYLGLCSWPDVDEGWETPVALDDRIQHLAHSTMLV